MYVPLDDPGLATGTSEHSTFFDSPDSKAKITRSEVIYRVRDNQLCSPSYISICAISLVGGTNLPSSTAAERA